MNAASSPARRSTIAAVVILVAVLHTLDTSIANVALPHIQGSLAASQDQISWMLTSYIVATAIMTAPTPFLADRFGRKRLFFTATAAFVFTSMLCGVATSLGQLVVFRILQGAVGASLMPLALNILFDIYPPEEHSKASAIFSFGSVIGPVLGPPLGGYITEVLSWRWLFFMNVPLGIIALIGVALVVPEAPRRSGRHFDGFGFASLGLALGALQLALDRGHALDWFNSPEIIAEFVVAGSAAYFFIVHSLTVRTPFLDLRLLTDRNCVVSLMSTAVICAVLFASLALLPTYMQNLMGIPVQTAGLLLTGRGLASMVTMFLLSRYYNLLGPVVTLVAGCLCAAAGLYKAAHFTLSVGFFDIFMSNVLLGIGLAAISIPAMALLFQTLPNELRAEASTLASLMRNLGGSVGISCMVTRLASSTQIHHAQLGEHITAFGSALPASWDWSTSAGALSLNQEVTRQAASMAYFGNFNLMMWGTLLLMPIAFMFRQAKPSAT